MNHPATGVPAFMEPPMSMTVVVFQDPQLLQRAPEDEGFLAILQARRPQDPQRPAGTRRAAVFCGSNYRNIVYVYTYIIINRILVVFIETCFKTYYWAIV